MVLLGLKTDLLDDADTLAALANHGKRVVTPEMVRDSIRVVEMEV